MAAIGYLYMKSPKGLGKKEKQQQKYQMREAADISFLLGK
jgi:hypothetical protein